MAEEQYVAISADDSFLHVGRANDLLPHLDSETLTKIEIYDSRGRLMRIVKSAGEKPSLAPIDDGEPGPSDKQLLLDRISSALACIQVRVDRSKDPQLKGQRVPVVLSDLKVVLAALSASAFFELPPAGAGEAGVDTRGTPAHEATH